VSEIGAESPGVTGAAFASALGMPAGGILEELDGSPIGLPRDDVQPAATALPWRWGFVAATALAVRRPRLWVFALVAFLARGGLAVLAFPIVVVPTFIGLSNFVGPASVSAEGPGFRLVALVAVGTAAAAALAITGIVVAAIAEAALHRATVEPNGDGVGVEAAPGDLPGPGDGLVAVTGMATIRQGAVRIAAIRLTLLAPVAIVVALAVPTWVAVAYRELTLPSDVAAPLAARVFGGAPAASLAVLGTWLAAEVVGGFAARRAVLLGASIPRALAGGLLDPLRAPLGTALTVAIALGATLLVLAPAWWAVGAAWDTARHVLADGTRVLGAFGAAFLLAAAWLALLLLAAIAAAWRATLLTMELLRRRR
jgi:hypothetical protein